MDEQIENKPLSMVESAHQAADKLRIENERMEKNIAKIQELKAFETLGGLTEAGKQPEPVKVETAAEYKKRIMSGQK